MDEGGLLYWETLRYVNPLNTKLNPICHLLAFLGAHPIIHVSRVRVKQGSEVGIYFHRGPTFGEHGWGSFLLEEFLFCPLEICQMPCR